MGHGSRLETVNRRWRKSAAELELMRHAAAIAAGGIQLAMQRTHPGVFEFQLESTFGRQHRRS